MDAPDDVYKDNIQIGELNALNACMAVIMYKQYRAFYRKEQSIYHAVFEIGGLKLLCRAAGEDEDEQNNTQQTANDQDAVA